MVKKVLYLSTLVSFYSITTPTHYLSQVFNSTPLRHQFASFLDTVLRQVPSNTFYDHIDRLNLHENDIALYNDILKCRESFTPLLLPVYQLQSLKNKKKELGKQARVLLHDLISQHCHIHGCVEIGNPGTYTSVIKEFLPIHGPIYAINESESITDRLQFGGIKPYTKFVPLHDYAPIAPHIIADNSVELVICYRGLHHIPIEQLDPFLESIARILKPGGTFLLRDHDIKNEDIKALVHTAHSVYNLIVTAEPLANEILEYRNFQPLEYWINLLQKHGLTTSSERLLQHGDPTLNTMIKATKVPCNKQETLDHISTTLKYKPDYAQDITQTYLTAPEWYNVDVAQEYGSYINHTPFYQFPYMKNIATYWKIFAESWKVAARKKGHWHVLSSPYTFMNLFVGSSMTVEHAAKALISAPIRWMYAGVPVVPLQALVQDPHNEIALVDPNIQIIASYAQSPFKLVALPRYKKFTACMIKLARTSIVIYEIAGNKEIHVKARYKRTTHIKQPDGCIKNFEWHVPTQPDYTYCGLTIQVNLLHQVLANLHNQHIEILHIHDF